MQQTVWKVCSLDPENQDEDVFLSLTYSFLKDNRLRYEIDKTTKPRITGSKIFAFDSIERARVWRGETMVILECLANISERQRDILPYLSCKDMQISEEIEYCWETVEKKPTWAYNGVQIPPAGTILCDNITPIRRVE